MKWINLALTVIIYLAIYLAVLFILQLAFDKQLCKEYEFAKSAMYLVVSVFVAFKVWGISESFYKWFKSHIK